MSDKPSAPAYTARPTLLIDLGVIKANYETLKTKTPKAHVSAVVKADAYGLGIERVGRALFGAGCRNFFVATAGEGKALRAAIGDGASIYVLNGPAPRDITLIFGSHLKPVINSLAQAQLWADAAQTTKSPPYSALHIDTGMNRLGFSAGELTKLSKNKGLLNKIQPDLIMSHLACAPDKNHALNQRQLKAFKRAAAQLPMLPMSLANTAGIYLGPQYHFNMVRPGIGLYGGAATLDPSAEAQKPAVSLMAPVLQIRTLKAGNSLGYNASYTAKTDRRIAVVGAGYADGIPVAASAGTGEPPKLHARLRRQSAPVIGRVSMDLTALDITNTKEQVLLGDWAEFWGRALDTSAGELNTINYELLTRLSTRSNRRYS